jgi:glutamate racemase
VLGVFDSGVGGLSVWREIVAALPHTPIIYLADQAYMPYGERSSEQVQRRALCAAEWLLNKGCALIVVACNSASAAALDALRAKFPGVPFVGVEPAIKPAAQRTRTGVIAVLATHTTLRSQRYAGLVNRWGEGVRVIEQPCPRWVSAVEHLTDYQHAPADLLTGMVDECVFPLLEQRADALVLGCTHFPFLRPWIDQAVKRWRAAQADAPAVIIFDPAPAVAQRARQLWLEQVVAHSAAPSHAPPSAARGYEFWTTQDAERFEATASVLLGRPVDARWLAL